MSRVVVNNFVHSVEKRNSSTERVQADKKILPGVVQNFGRLKIRETSYCFYNAFRGFADDFFLD
jgi:hypothetical protein